MLKKLKIKFIFINLALITAVLATCFFALYFTVKNNVIDESKKALETFVIITDKEGKKQGELNKPSENKSDSMFDFTPSEEVIVNKNLNLSVFCVKTDNRGNLLSVYGYKETLTSDNKELLKGYTDLALEKTGQKGSFGLLEKQGLRYYVSDTKQNFYISFLDISQEKEQISTFVKGFYAVAVPLWVFVLLISFILATFAIRPAEKSWEKQKQFIADASHELKTPLSVILASTEVMLSGKNELSKEQRKWLECTKYEGERMKELLSDMLYLAKADDEKELEKQKKASCVLVDLSETLNEILLNFEITCFEKGKTLEQAVEDNVFVKGNESDLKRLIGIFLDNALKYSGEQGRISVCLESVGSKCVLKFSNTGEPIPPQDIPHLFERFYRASESRSRDEGGYGLGLSIAQNIANAHNAKISVSSNKEKTEFVVKLPISGK